MTVEYAFNGAGNLAPADSQEGMIDFGDGLGRVRAYRRKNRDGTLSGWIANTVFISPKAHIGREVRVPDSAVIWSDARLEKPDDLRVGSNWVAYRAEHGFRLVSKVPDTAGTTRFESWDELPRILHGRRFISTMEYLASAVKSEREP